MSNVCNKVRSKAGDMFTRLQWTLIMLSMLIFAGIPTYAQVELTIPTDDIFTSINSWIATFAPIVAIGIGIAAAIAILNFVGMQIVKAFRAH
jgi:hypothetical protein